MSKKNKIICSLILAGLFLRFGFVFLHPYPDEHDAYQYDLIATNIVNGHGISAQTGPPYSHQIDRVPFYPIFMSFFYLVFGHHLIVIRIVQAILSIFTAFFVYQITKRVIKADSRLSVLPVISFGLVLLCPFLIFFVAILFTETLVAFLITLSILLFVYGMQEKNSFSYFYSGTVIGLAFMTRPEVFALPFAIAAAFLFHNLHNLRRTISKITIYLLPFFLIWGIWIAKNYSTFNRFVPITAQSGALLLVGTYPPNRYEKDFPEEIKEEYVKFRFIPEKERISVVSDMKKRAFKRILNEPLRYAGYCFRRIPILWISSYMHYIGIDDTFGGLFKEIKKDIETGKSFFIKGRFLLLKAALYLIDIFYIFSGILGMILLLKKWPTMYPLYLTLIYFTLIHLPLGDASPRYVIKVMPLLLIFSSAGILHSYCRLKRFFKNKNRLFSVIAGV